MWRIIFQGGTGNPLLDMYSQYAAAAYSPQVGGLHRLNCCWYWSFFSFSPSPPWFIILSSPLTSYLLSKWCRRWPRLLSRRSPPRWSSSSPSNFPNPLWQVRGLLIIPHNLHVQAKDNIWNDQRKPILASFRNRIFQILPGSVLPLIMTHEKIFVAKYKQFSDKMKMYQSQFSDEISKRILSTLDYG